MSDIYEENSDEELNKEQVVFEIRTFVVEEYIKSFDGEANRKISVGEFLKAQEMICKLEGYFDSSGNGQDLPNEARLKIP